MTLTSPSIVPGLSRGFRASRGGHGGAFSRLRRTILPFSLLMFVLPAFANDTSVGGTGVDLYSIEETSVFMAAEDIVITFSGASWQVVAAYTFENPTDKPVRLQVGFPEVGCPKDSEGDCHARAFRALETEVDGKPVKHRQGSLAKTERWAQHLGTFWLFDVDFPARQKVSVVHRYEMDSTIDSMGTNSFTYVTRTGATWARPIGHAKFRVRLPPHTLRVMGNETSGLPEPPRFVSAGGRNFSEVTFERKQWTPTGDLAFAFATGFSSHALPRFEAAALASRAKALGFPLDDVCPWLPPYFEVKPTTGAQAQNCRNHVYALWGYPFKKKLLSDLYYAGGSSWRRAADGNPFELARDPAPLPSFSMDSIPTSEKRVLTEIRIETPVSDGEVLPTAPSTSGTQVVAETRATVGANPTEAKGASEGTRETTSKPVPAPTAPQSGCSSSAARAGRWSFFVALGLLFAPLRRRWLRSRRLVAP